MLGRELEKLSIIQFMNTVKLVRRLLVVKGEVLLTPEVSFMGMGSRATLCLFEAILKVVPLSARSLTQRLYEHRKILDLEQK